MQHKKYLLAALASLCSLYGCSDDSNKDNNENNPKAECSSSSDCDSGKCLNSGKCAELVNLDDACDSEHVCKSPLICKSGKCQNKREDDPNPPDESICKSDDSCAKGEVCERSQCVAVQILNKGDDCKTNDRVKICQSDLVCWSGKCWDESEINDDDRCKSDADCAGEEIYKTCLSDGSCGFIARLGELCLDVRSTCEDGLICEVGICSTIVGDGQHCSEEEGLICANGLICLQGINECHSYEINLPEGSECNDQWKKCASGLLCEQNICQSRAGEDEYCDDSSNKSCKNGLLCLNSKCTPVGTNCATSADCLEKDSYCCLSDECGLPGRCVPYDDHHKNDESCGYKTKAGIFEAQVQCRWDPQKSDFPNSQEVENTPLVGHFGNKQNLNTVVAFFSEKPTVVRFINPETCETLESIEYAMRDHYSNYAAAADLDNDGLLEPVFVTEDHHFVAFKWNASLQKHEVMWVSDEDASDFVTIFDINGDGIPEVIGSQKVFDSKTGKCINASSSSLSKDATLGFFDNDPQNAMLATANGLYKWDPNASDWKSVYRFGDYAYVAYADFGTPGATPGEFDFTKLDGKAEIVSGNKIIDITTPPTTSYFSYATVVFDPPHGESGGPVTIGDFDNDGYPEIGIASKDNFTVYDPQCKGYEAGKCADEGILWQRWSQDGSSGVTGSTLFDFDGDGKTEAVYGDECFIRVYDGATGSILFSSKRTSYTWAEAAIVADVDDDGSAEIVIGSSSISPTCATDDESKQLDPIHQGIRCQNDEDCPSGKNCDTSIGLCTCTSDDECNSLYLDGRLIQQYACADQIHEDVGIMQNRNGSELTPVKPIGSRPDGWTSSSPKVCRATRKDNYFGKNDVVIYRDRLDRWVSARNIWNQHSYSVINVEDDGKVPSSTHWMLNWMAQKTGITIPGTSDPIPRYNNYRQNSQGEFGSSTAPDITGRFIAGSICGTTNDGRHVISGKLCNRGTKPVATKLPATFFYYDENAADHRGETICTSYTIQPVGVGECGQVGCEVSEETLNELEGKKVLMVTNLDEHGNANTVECNTSNNTDTILVESCKADNIVIIN